MCEKGKDQGLDGRGLPPQDEAGSTLERMIRLYDRMEQEQRLGDWSEAVRSLPFRKKLFQEYSI